MGRLQKIIDFFTPSVNLGRAEDPVPHRYLQPYTDETVQKLKQRVQELMEQGEYFRAGVATRELRVKEMEIAHHEEMLKKLRDLVKTLEAGYTAARQDKIYPLAHGITPMVEYWENYPYGNTLRGHLTETELYLKTYRAAAFDHREVNMPLSIEVAKALRDFLIKALGDK